MTETKNAFDIPDFVRELVDRVVLPQLPEGAAVPFWYYDHAVLMELNDILATRFRMVDGDRYICIVPFIYTRAIILGALKDEGSYIDRWCFHDMAGAVTAFDEWTPQFQSGKLANEPEGWHRHPLTGRYRKDGDPASEVMMR